MINRIPKTQAEAEAFIAEQIGYTNKLFPGTLNDMMHPVYEACDFKKRTLTVSFEAMPWMSNPSGILHGGAISSAMDIAMGLLVYMLNDRKIPPTISLQVNFVRPVPLGKRFFIKSRAHSIGRTTAYTDAELWIEGCPDTIMATASGTYYTAGKQLAGPEKESAPAEE